MDGRPAERVELDELLSFLLPHAQELLQKAGEYYPFGCTMATDGQIALAAGYTGTEYPNSQDVIDLLVDGMRAQAANGSIRASGICYDVRSRGPDGKVSDAIAVSLEHRVGDHVLVLMPYAKRRFGGVQFGAVTSIDPGDRRIFVGG